MNSPEDALKAVESLAEIVREWIKDPDPELRGSILARLERLQDGCLALRLDRRGDADARAILNRDRRQVKP